MINFDSLIQFLEVFGTEEACRDYLTKIIWKNGEYCPHCGSKKIYHFSNGKIHKCAHCRKQFSITVGTIFEDSKVPLKKWFMAIYLLTCHKKGISSLQLSRDLGVTQKTAWFMLQRLRYAMQTQEFTKPLDGIVEIDETYVGGSERFKHKNKKTRRDIMQRAQKIDNDEFYTRYEDVEKEVSMYPLEIWRDKCVFCNCDDAVGETRTEKDSSAFALYFIKNFIRLGLKKLICTHYSGQMDLFQAGAKGYIFTKEGVQEMTAAPKGYTGCFEDPLSLKILKEEADIVCTNPPFSKAIDYWRTVINSGKKFLIISNITNCITHAFVHYFINKQVWAGYNSVDWYMNPKREPVRAAGHWFTNIKITNRTKVNNLKFVPLDEIPDRFKKYDDNGILCVDNNYIPADYNEPFAVSTRPILNGILEKGYKIISDKQFFPYINGKQKFRRVLIQKEQ